MLKVENLKKSFGSFEAVKGISFSVAKGEVLGFLGPNGAGKSTTMRMITGFIPPTSGTAVICGHDILKDPIGAKSALGYLPEAAPSYRAMTVEDFLTFIAKARGFSGAAVKERVAAVIEKARLANVAKQTIDTLSKGYRQRVGVAQALLGSPQLIILDEPTVGLDPAQVIELRRLIRELGRTHTVILSSHILSEVKAVCDKALILSQGHLAAVVDLAAEERDLEELFLELTAPEETSDKKED